MTPMTGSPMPTATLDYDNMLVLALGISKKTCGFPNQPMHPRGSTVLMPG